VLELKAEADVLLELDDELLHGLRLLFRCGPGRADAWRVVEPLALRGGDAPAVLELLVDDRLEDGGVSHGEADCYWREGFESSAARLGKLNAVRGAPLQDPTDQRARPIPTDVSDDPDAPVLVALLVATLRRLCGHFAPPSYPWADASGLSVRQLTALRSHGPLSSHFLSLSTSWPTNLRTIGGPPRMIPSSSTRTSTVILGLVM